MEKKDLKTGMRLTFENGETAIVLRGTTKGDIASCIGSNGSWCPLSYINEDLTSSTEKYIVKVEDSDINMGFLNTYKTIWERKEVLNGWCVPVEGWGSVIILMKDGKPIHGLGGSGNPFKCGNSNLEYRPATQQEIEERLFSYCKKYIDADYECLMGWGTCKSEYSYFEAYNKGIWIKFCNGTVNKICDEYGNWAEIKETPKPSTEDISIEESVYVQITKTDRGIKKGDILKLIKTHPQNGSLVEVDHDDEYRIWVPTEWTKPLTRTDLLNLVLVEIKNHKKQLEKIIK